MGGWRSFRAWVGAFVHLGNGAVTVFGTTAVFQKKYFVLSNTLRCITSLLWRGSSTKQGIRLLLYCCSMVGRLVGGCVARSVGGCVVRYVGGVLSATWKRMSCRCGCCVACCFLSLLPNADVR